MPQIRTDNEVRVTLGMEVIYLVLLAVLFIFIFLRR